jgi:pimeloyl-ACP methyl ester carboxylesterase
MALIETSTGSFWVADHRQPDKTDPTMLLIHGAAGSRLVWPGELRRLPGTQAVVPDLAGHGKSPPPGRNTVSDYTADILALMDALNIPQAIITGHSMGGATAMTLALDHPGRVRGLVLIATGAKLSVHPDLLEGFAEEFERAATLMVDRWWSPNAAEERRLESYERLAQTPVDVTIGDLEACNAFDIRDRLGEIHKPTLIVSGTADLLTPPMFADYLHEHIAGSQLFKVEGSGHMVMVEQPQPVADAMTQWLQTLT